ncbi:hypothetical protein SDC9_199402 [bioreactor metagenome]|uniref:Uncharacterized protein n=1 Tax=bioreactor metagenome TaxID=1076179 RepID=A0A645IX36_9ZZZZ
MHLGQVQIVQRHPRHRQSAGDRHPTGGELGEVAPVRLEGLVGVPDAGDRGQRADRVPAQHQRRRTVTDQ